MIPFFRSTVAAKFGMAVTGLLLVGFVVGHLSGNLLVFAGQDAINDYAYFLQHNAPLLWGARIGLSVMLVTHVVLAIRVKRSHSAARPVAYAYENTVQASLASRTMAISGMVLLVYILFHLAHFTVGWVDGESYHLEQVMADGSKRHDVYNMVVRSFQYVPISLLYVLGMALLGMHLSHSLKSMLQTLGLRHAIWTPRIDVVLNLAGWVLAVGYSTIPVAVLLGIVEPVASAS